VQLSGVLALVPADSVDFIDPAIDPLVVMPLALNDGNTSISSVSCHHITSRELMALALYSKVLDAHNQQEFGFVPV